MTAVLQGQVGLRGPPGQAGNPGLAVSIHQFITEPVVC